MSSSLGGRLILSVRCFTGAIVRNGEVYCMLKRWYDTWEAVGGRSTGL